MNNRLKLFLSLCLVFSGFASGFKAEASVADEGYINFERLNESTMKLNIDGGESYIDDEGTAFIKDSLTGDIVELPREAVDVDEMPVNLVYKKDGNDLIVEYHSMGMQTFGFWKCTLGTAGGAGTGALGGMSIGAMAGTPVTVLGGTVFGGIAGGMTGAAAACF